jgi:hypothetical protein
VAVIVWTVDTETHRLLWDIAARIEVDYRDYGAESARSLLNLWLASGDDPQTLARNAMLIGCLRELGCPLVTDPL